MEAEVSFSFYLCRQIYGCALELIVAAHRTRVDEKQDLLTTSRLYLSGIGDVVISLKQRDAAMISRQWQNRRTTVAVPLLGTVLLLALCTATPSQSNGASAFALSVGGGLVLRGSSTSSVSLRDAQSVLSMGRGGRRLTEIAMRGCGAHAGEEGSPLRQWSRGVVGGLHTMGRTRQIPQRRQDPNASVRASERFVPGRSSVSLSASSVPINQANLAVSIDKPILSSLDGFARGASNPSTGASLWPSFLAVLLSDVVRTAIVAFFLAAGLSLAARFARSSRRPASTSGGGFPLPDFSRAYKATRGRIDRVVDALSFRGIRGRGRAKSADDGIPMPFDGQDGWGKCTLRSKTRIGQSSYVSYEFNLPHRDYSLPLALGQSLDFCCLDGGDEVVTGSYYPATTATGGHAKTGSFSIVVPDRGPDGNAAIVGRQASGLVEVFKNELRPGDEVAIKPGKSSLSYRGEHIPVTDIVYLASGMGIVPIVDQVKAILPNGASSVEVASVVWINDDRDDFDLAVDELEREYFKYSTKLAVSCVVEEGNRRSMEDNPEIEESVPYFNAGSMAVISGPRRFSERAKSYLTRKGYPEDCICVLS